MEIAAMRSERMVGLLCFFAPLRMTVIGNKLMH